MRDFFKQQLAELPIYGIQNVTYMTPEQIAALLDRLTAVSRQYESIPQDDQKAIVRRQMIQDKDFKKDGGLTPGKLHQWFYSAKLTGKYDPKEATVEVPAAPPEIADKYAQQLLATIVGSSIKPVEKTTQSELENITLEDLERSEGRKAISTGVKSWTPEQHKEWKLHNDYLREKWIHAQDPRNYEGAKLTNEFMSEEKWLEEQKLLAQQP